MNVSALRFGKVYIEEISNRALKVFHTQGGPTACRSLVLVPDQAEKDAFVQKELRLPDTITFRQLLNQHGNEYPKQYVQDGTLGLKTDLFLNSQPIDIKKHRKDQVPLLKYLYLQLHTLPIVPEVRDGFTQKIEALAKKHEFALPKPSAS